MEEKKLDCPCKKIKCERHGYCSVCRTYHEGKKHPPACERLEKELHSQE